MARTIGKMACKPEATVAISSRDILICQALVKAKILRARDLVPLLFPSLPIARRRLLKLVRAGIIAGYVCSLASDSLYCLARRGRELLPPELRNQTPRFTPKQQVDPGLHHWLGVRLWVGLVGSAHRAEGVSLGQFTFEWELEGDHLSTLRSYRPDATLILATDDRDYAFLVEQDAASESPSLVVAEKFVTASRLIATRTPVGGIVPDGVLLVAPSIRRLRALARAAADRRLSLPVFARVVDARTDAITVEAGWFFLQDLLCESPREVGLVGWSTT